MSRPPFVDAHVHFHDLEHPRLRYEWLEPGGPPDPVLGDDRPLRSQRYWADDFLAETRFQRVAKAVHVQAAIGSEDPVEETRWLQAFADRLGVPQGIVSYADLADPGVGGVLERHAEFPNLRGIRDLRYDDYLTNPAWRRGYAQLEEHGLVCCDDPDVAQMPAALDLARRFPGITFCVDHCGFPKGRDPEYFARWRAAIGRLAAAENVVVKISGLGQADHRWTVASIRPWVLACIEAFGVERSFLASNWPVDRLYSSYGDVLEAYDTITAGFSSAEREALFATNAERVFQLGSDSSPGSGATASALSV